MSVSWWHQELAPRETAACDVCVIGGGIAGLAAADACARAGASVVLLERHTIGWGASTRNAGYLMRGAADNYAAACDQLGRGRAMAAWRDSEANLRLLIDRFGIDRLSTFRRTPSCLVAASDDEAADLRRSAELMTENGFDVRLLYSGTDSLWRSLEPDVALENPADAAINPAEMVAHIADVVREHGSVTIVEGAEVFGIRSRGGRTEVASPSCTVNAGCVLVCTNAYASELLPELVGTVKPNRGQMLAMRHPTAQLDAAYYLDRGSEYIRQTHDGTIVVGGMRKRVAAAERTSDPTPTAAVQSALEDFARRAIGAGGKVIARWAGTMGFSPDGLPIVREIGIEGLEPGRAVFCGGFTGHGMSLGAITASRAAERLLAGLPADG
ncbi:MAG: FAD-dependent oxidoreductase [Planctomycetota bacterium]